MAFGHRHLGAACIPFHHVGNIGLACMKTTLESWYQAEESNLTDLLQRQAPTQSASPVWVLG